MDSINNRSSPELPTRIFLVEDNSEHPFIAVKALHQLLGESVEIIIADSAEQGTRSYPSLLFAGAHHLALSGASGDEVCMNGRSPSRRQGIFMKKMGFAVRFVVSASALCLLLVAPPAGAGQPASPTFSGLTANPASVSPRHYSMLGPRAALPTEAKCIASVTQSPVSEHAPWNQDDGSPAHWNSNQPPPGGVPSYFYDYAPCCSELPNSDFAKVDGNYSGSTDDLIRITACKWGVDEDYIRAQSEIESGWHQDCAAAHGGEGCYEGGDLNNPPGCTPTSITTDAITPITPNGQFCELQGFGDLTATNQYASWSIAQTKVYYEWMTWPMMEESTSFALDYRYAEMRGCVNGDQYGYFHSQRRSSGTNYLNAVKAARTNPHGPSKVSGWNNLQYIAYGCIETHFSGDWFGGRTDSYLKSFLSSLNSANWPGGRR